MYTARKQLLAQVVKRALTTPASLGLLTASSLLLVTTPELWPLAQAGFLGELGLLFGLVRSERFIRTVQDETQEIEWQRRSRRFGQVQAAVDGSTAELLGRIQQLQDRILKEWSNRGALAAFAGDALGVSRRQVSDLMEQCLRLAQKRHQLQSYLRETRPADLQRHAVQLQEKWEQSHDDVARQLYERALREKRSELETYAALQQAVSRIDGQLEAIECGFGNLLGKVVRLKSLDTTHATVARDQLYQDLTQLTAGVAALEASVDEALAR